MYPILFKLGPFNIFGLEIGPIFVYTYGLMVALGFLSAIITAVKFAKRKNISEEVILDLSLWILIFSIVGARILYVILNFSYYKDNPVEIIQVYKGGLVFYGGFIGGIITCIWYTYTHKLSLWQIGDIFAPGIALGQGIGRIGCFLRGCCYGKPTSLPWGVTFPPDSLASYLYGNNHHIHPTQLYASVINLSISGFLTWFMVNNKAKFDGQIFILYVILYATGRMFTEIFRGDVERGMLGPLSTSQIFAVIFIIAGIIMYKYLCMERK